MRYVLLVCLVSAALSCSAQTPGKKLDEWPSLIDANKADEARKLCSAFADSQSPHERAEAEKCLANVELIGNGIIELTGNEQGGGTLGGAYSVDATDKAIQHLDRALKSAPQDLSIHQGRLHLLEISGRFDEMLTALKDSIATYKGENAVNAWLDYSEELGSAGQITPALEFTRILDQSYPNNPDVIANIGAFLSMLHKPAEATPYLEKSVALAPDDPINNWDLARAYDADGKIDLADCWYKKSLPLFKDPEQRKENNCLYGQFLETKRHDRPAACKLERANCPGDEDTACKPEPKS